MWLSNINMLWRIRFFFSSWDVKFLSLQLKWKYTEKKRRVLTASITFLYWSDIILQTLVIERNGERQTLYRRTPLEFLLKRNQVFWLNFKVAQFGEGHRKAKRNLFLACTSGTGCVRPPTAARRRRWPPRSSTSAGWSREPSPRGRWGSQGFAPESF